MVTASINLLTFLMGKYVRCSKLSLAYTKTDSHTHTRHSLMTFNAHSTVLMKQLGMGQYVFGK